jgi:molybdate transport system substrate-binding protein
VSVFRIGEAAQLLGISPDTVRRWVDAGRLVAIRDEHGHRVIDGVNLAEYARSQGAEVDAGAEGSSARNRLRGIVTAVVKDTVMAQVDIQADPGRAVPFGVPDEPRGGRRPGSPGRVSRCGGDQINHGRGGETAHDRRRKREKIVRARWIRSTLIGFAIAATLVTAACGTSNPRASASSTGLAGTVNVFAAASLTESFTQIGKDFEAANPGTKVTFNFGASSTLANQINQGAPADVFAAASPTTMKTVTDAGNGDGTPTTFVRNQLVIAVPKGNPKNIMGLADLTKAGVKVALCAVEVPCGAAAKKALDAAKVTLKPVTLEPDVKAALSKVKLGEVDAALVYRTDAKAAAADVDGVEFPESAGAINDYPIVVLKNSANKAAAQAFVAYVLSDKGKAVLTAAGFQSP